jgi:phosphoribosylanthranilate isomerase
VSLKERTRSNGPARFVRVKVCGVTDAANARAIVELGVDEVGFNFYRPSLRYVAPEAARAIALTLPPEVRRVGVFVDASAEDVERIAEFVQLDRLQLHGDESPDFCLARRLPVVKAFRAGPDLDPARVRTYRSFPILLDGYSAGLPGGTGRLADWTLGATLVAEGVELYLAGGLGPHNVLEAFETVRPAALDLNSGVESKPGLKDPELLRRVLERLAPYRRTPVSGGTT